MNALLHDQRFWAGQGLLPADRQGYLFGRQCEPADDNAAGIASSARGRI